MAAEIKNARRWWEPKSPTRKVRDTPPLNKEGFWKKKERKVEIPDGSEQTAE